jgi:ubiquinone/menaquinone biosynthesis C-methylase UbiE
VAGTPSSSSLTAGLRSTGPWHLDDLPVKYKTGRALDFGCGIGRTTQALAFIFDRVDGVDISDEMIRLALGHDTGRCCFHHNACADLKLFKARTFDFVYSMIVLQHMPQDMQHGYVREFFRVLKPGASRCSTRPKAPTRGIPAGI